MKNILFFNEDVNFTLKQKTLIRQWIVDTALSEGFSIGALNFIFCSDDHLHSMNVEHLDHDTLTDIITFDYTQANFISGDIFISVDRVKDNAKSFGVSAAQEMKRVLIHGVLHLLGYKDKTDTDQAEMTERENHFLSLF